MKRIMVDLLILISIGFILFALPVRIEKQGLELFLYKMLLVSAGFIHAHIIRKLAFPYIDFRTARSAMHKLLVITLYAIIIWAYARGG